MCEIIAAHHEQLNKVLGRASLASSLAQAVTKSAWDASRKMGDFKTGDTVLVHRTAANKMLPHFEGPHTVDSVTADGNFVTVRHFLASVADERKIHVSRLLHFDASRATTDELVNFQVPDGSDVVKEVLEHRRLDDGSLEFKLAWLGDPVPSWLPGKSTRRLTKVEDYCRAHGLGSPASKEKNKVLKDKGADVPSRGRGSGRVRARGRARGRGRAGRGVMERAAAQEPVVATDDEGESDGDVVELLPMERLVAAKGERV